MVVLKCPSCGGELRVTPGTDRIRCEHCKTTVLILDPTKGTARVDPEGANTPQQEAAAMRIVKFTLFGTAITVMLPVVLTVILFVIIGLVFLVLALTSAWLTK